MPGPYASVFACVHIHVFAGTCVCVCTCLLCVFVCTEYMHEHAVICELFDYVHMWAHCACLHILTCVWPGLEAALAPFQELTGDTLQLSPRMA